MIRFLYENWLDDGTLTASSEASGFPVENIQNRWHTRHWRSTGVAANWVACDLGGQKNIKSLVIKYHNFKVGAGTLYIKANNTGNPDGPFNINQQLTVTAETIVYNWSSNQLYQYWWLIIGAGITADAYFRIGRMYLGLYSSPTYNFRRKDEIPRDPSSKSYSTGGQVSADEEIHFTEISYNFLLLSADKTTMKSIFEEVGTSKPYFICDDPTAAATTTYYVQNLDDWEYSYVDEGKDQLTVIVETMR